MKNLQVCLSKNQFELGNTKQKWLGALLDRSQGGDVHEESREQRKEVIWLAIA